MNPADKYHLVVYWSDEDQCYVGRRPDLFYGGTHGDNPEQVFKALREMVAEAVEAYQAEGKPLPMCTSARTPTLSLLHFTLDGDAGNSRLPCELELGYHGLRRRMT
jgi:predicted RNase H-like HicB family nuclease